MSIEHRTLNVQHRMLNLKYEETVLRQRLHPPWQHDLSSPTSLVGAKRKYQLIRVARFFNIRFHSMFDVQRSTLDVHL